MASSRLYALNIEGESSIPVIRSPVALFGAFPFHLSYGKGRTRHRGVSYEEVPKAPAIRGDKREECIYKVLSWEFHCFVRLRGSVTQWHRSLCGCCRNPVIKLINSLPVASQASLLLLSRTWLLPFACSLGKTTPKKKGSGARRIGLKDIIQVKPQTSPQPCIDKRGSLTLLLHNLSFSPHSGLGPSFLYPVHFTQT